MLFSFVNIDKAGALQTRLDNRPAHVEYLKSHADQIVIGGPMLGDDGETMIGSLLVCNFPDMAAAQAFADNDPYAKAGLFESVTIRPYKAPFVNVDAAE